MEKRKIIIVLIFFLLISLSRFRTKPKRLKVYLEEVLLMRRKGVRAEALDKRNQRVNAAGVAGIQHIVAAEAGGSASPCVVR